MYDEIKSLLAEDHPNEVETKCSFTYVLFVFKNKNRRKAIFDLASKGLFFLREGDGYH